MSRSVSLGIETNVVVVPGEYKKAGELYAGESVLSVDSLPNTVLSIRKERKRTLFLSDICLPEEQAIPVCRIPNSDHETRMVELCLFQPQAIKAVEFNPLEHALFRSCALWPYSEVHEEPFVVGKTCCSHKRDFPFEFILNDRKTRSSLLCGALCSEERTRDFFFVCNSLGLDPTKKKSELLEDLATSNSCSLVKTYPQNPRKSQVVILKLEREVPIFVQNFVNI